LQLVFDDLVRLDSGQTIEADICVIGAGAAGISIACAFIGSDNEVCVVESGGFDFEADTQNLYSGRSADTSVALEAGRLRMFGGTTNHWGGRCAEFSADELAERSWVPYSGWPISAAELARYYDRARKVCGFNQPWRGPEETFELLGLDRRPAVAGDVEPQLWHITQHDGGMYWNFGTQYRTVLERTRNVRVLLHANLVAFRTDPTMRHVESVEVRSLTGNAASVRARLFVICTGAIENARLLLLPNQYGPAGLGNSHDLVGRFFMQHIRAKAATIAVADRLSPIQDFYNDFTGPDQAYYEVGVTLSKRLQSNAKILNGSAVLEYEGDPRAGTTAAQDIWRRLRAGEWADDLGAKVWRVISDLPAFATNAERWLKTGRHPLLPLKVSNVIVDLEQMPDPDSRVRLGTDRDPLGLPRVVTYWKVSGHERETARQFMIALGTAFGMRDLGRLRVEPEFEQPGDAWVSSVTETYHYLGTTRMAVDPSQGVVDTNCRVHGMDNLFVGGSSVFPTGGHVNPTFTITALALRLADYMRKTIANVK
jgi:choline dehydrogenase-like flavoprotein